MKKLIFTLLVACLFKTAFAQNLTQTDTSQTLKKNIPHNSFLIFSLGQALPLGSYASNTSFSNGFAMAGLDMNGELGIFFNKNAGWGLKGGKFTNNVDNTQYFAFNNPISIPNIVLDYPLRASFGSADKWKNTYWLTGPYLSFPFKHFSIDIKALFGFMKGSNIPFSSISIYYYNTSSLSYYFIEKARNTSFAYNPGANFRIHLSKVLQMKVSVDYIYSKAHLDYRINNSGNAAIISAGNTRQTISALNISWGLGFRLPSGK
jgi:hypothetical protein